MKIIHASAPANDDVLYQRQADIWFLMNQYRETFENDQIVVEPTLALELAQDAKTFLIEHHGDTVGLVMFTEVQPKLRATAHALIQPKYMLKAFKKKVFEQIIQDFVSLTGVKKIKAEPMMSQKAAIKFLKRLGFKRIAVLSHEVSVKGQSMPIVLHQLSTKQYGVT